MKSLKIWLNIVLLCCLPLVGFAADEDTKSLQEAYYTWIDAVQMAHGDPSIVVKLYAPNAILLPTLSEELLTNQVEVNEKDISDYFVKFTALRGLHAETNELITRDYGTVGTNVGFYTFTYQKNGQTKTVPARFSFVYQKDSEGVWRIIEHHSSVVPSYKPVAQK